MSILDSALAIGLLSGANYADLRTTRGALAHAEAREFNPIIGAHGERLVPLKAVALGIETGVYLHLQRTGHRRGKWVWVAAVVAANLGLAAWNRRQR